MPIKFSCTLAIHSYLAKYTLRIQEGQAREGKADLRHGIPLFLRGVQFRRAIGVEDLFREGAV